LQSPPASDDELRLGEGDSILPVYGTVAVLVVALTTQYIAFGTRLMNGAIIQVKAELEDAGQVAGARPTGVMRRITLPLLLPAVIAGWIWVAANSMRSFSVPVILASRNNEVFASQIWSLRQIGTLQPGGRLRNDARNRSLPDDNLAAALDVANHGLATA